MIFFRYKGLISCNQLGLNYSFPHYSTVLGAILANYHKVVKTPKYPRIDMFQLASQLEIRLLIGYNENISFAEREYKQYRNTSSKGKDNLYSPDWQNYCIGEYIIGIDGNTEFIETLNSGFFIIGGTNSNIYELEILDKKKLDAYKFIIPSKNVSTKVSFVKNEICLVSQISLNENKKIQGLYSTFEELDFEDLDETDFICFQDLLKNNLDMVKRELSKVKCV